MARQPRHPAPEAVHDARAAVLARELVAAGEEAARQQEGREVYPARRQGEDDGAHDQGGEREVVNDRFSLSACCGGA